MQVSDHDDHAHKEPVRHINVRALAYRDRHDVIQTECDPDQGDQNINRPFQLCVFLALGDSQRQCDHGQHDDQVPAPEGEPRQAVAPQFGPAGALHYIVAGGHQGTATKRENHRISMQRTQSPKGNVRNIEIHERPRQFGCNIYTEQRAYDQIYDCHDGKPSDHIHIVLNRYRLSCFHSKPPFRAKAIIDVLFTLFI